LLQAVDAPQAGVALDARLALWRGAVLDRAQLRQIRDRLQPVLLSVRRQDGEGVAVVERRPVEQREAASPLEALRLVVRGLLAGRHLVRLLDLLHDRPGVLGIDVDAAARQRLVGDLRRPDVVLEVDGEVLRPEHDLRLALAGLRPARARTRLLAAPACRERQRAGQKHERVERSPGHPIPLLVVTYLPPQPDRWAPAAPHASAPAA